MNLGGSIKINKFGFCIFLVILVLVVYYTRYDGPPEDDGDAIPVNPNEIQLRQLLIAAIQAARAGGAEVLDVATKSDVKESSKGKTLEGVNDPVTNADVRSHCVMQQGLHRIFPRVKIISEEDGTKAEANRCEAFEGRPAFDLDPTVLETDEIRDETVIVGDVTVWIDPLDATKEFTEKLVEYVTTMVCVAVRGKPVIGVIYNPFTKKTTWGWSGYNLFSEHLSPSRKSNKSDDDAGPATVIISRSHPGQVSETVKRWLGLNTNIVSAGGAGYKVLEVANGAADAYIHTTHIKKWDICAGNAILEAMGGRMTGLAGQPIVYDAVSPVLNDVGVLATFRHKHFLDKIRRKQTVAG